MNQRLEDRIRELCTKAATQDSDDWQETLRELQAALQEHTQRIRQMAAEIPIRPERRSKDWRDSPFDHN